MLLPLSAPLRVVAFTVPAVSPEGEKLYGVPRRLNASVLVPGCHWIVSVPALLCSSKRLNGLSHRPQPWLLQFTVNALCSPACITMVRFHTPLAWYAKSGAVCVPPLPT
jgi:hypothetical protein